MCARLFKTKLTNRITTHSFTFRKAEPAVLSGIVLVEWILANRIEHLHMYTHTHSKREIPLPPQIHELASECFHHHPFHCLSTLWNKWTIFFHLYRQFYFSLLSLYSDQFTYPIRKKTHTHTQKRITHYVTTLKRVFTQIFVFLFEQNSFYWIFIRSYWH